MNYIVLFAVVALAAVSRLIPHLNNASIITALAIFAAVYLPKKQAFALPLAARLLSDILLGFFPFQQMIAVYAAHIVGFFLGLWIKGSSEKPVAKWVKIAASGAVSAAVFFLITNFAFLYPTPQYTHDLSGIALAYAYGLPFLRGTALGDIGYTVALFGAYEVALAMKNRKTVKEITQHA
jgi:hypothetical protein